MTETIRLGTIAGIRIGLHWSVLGIIALLAFGLAGGILPSLVEGLSAATYIAAALVATTMFVLSLLAHEIAHAIVARRNGVEVDGITLWLLGGVARLKGEAPNAGADLRIAAVGPLVSLILGIVFFGLFWLVEDVTSELVQAVILYLGAVNLLLAAFNVIPAAPLDGGRILRAALWAWRGDRYQAQIWSARSGRVFGFGLVAFGLLWLIREGTGLWYILIGLFIVTMASAEENHAKANAALGNVRARDIMTPDPDTADPDQTVADFISTVAMNRRHSAFPLLGPGGDVQGLVTLNRLRGVPAEERAATTLGAIACPPDQLPIVAPNEPITKVLTRLNGCADGRALVMDGGRLAGIISPTDVSRAISLRGLGVSNFEGADLTQIDDSP
jgi:Zn-dependent protease/CBS domain-containing protein